MVRHMRSRDRLQTTSEDKSSAVHFHMIFVDGVYLTDGADPPVFRHVATSGAAELQALVQQIAERIGRMLEKRGLIERDSENAWLSSDPSLAGPLDDLIGLPTVRRTSPGYHLSLGVVI